MHNKKINNKAKSFVKLQIINLIIYLFVFVIISIIAVCSDIGKEKLFYVSLGYLSVSSFASGFVAGFKERKKGIICGMLSALPFLLIICILSIILNKFDIDYNLIISIIAALIFSAVGGIVAVNIKLK
ncbi:MAG: TIGR04086 family membrane protein [Clostridia bacterium]|nr:TIGR04086 family membrane protein [Clostridia bacterium]